MVLRCTRMCGRRRSAAQECAAPLRSRYARGPVSRVLSGGFHPSGDHSSGMRIAAHLKQPTRARRPDQACRCRQRRRCAYSVLLPVGFAMPPLLPAARCALAAPFRPCRQLLPRRAFTLKGRRPGGGVFSVALSLGSPPAGVTRHRRSVEPGLSSAVSRRGRPNLWHPATLPIGPIKVKLREPEGGHDDG